MVRAEFSRSLGIHTMGDRRSPPRFHPSRVVSGRSERFLLRSRSGKEGGAAFAESGGAGWQFAEFYESCRFHEAVKMRFRVNTIRFTYCRILVYRVFGIHENDN